MKPRVYTVFWILLSQINKLTTLLFISIGILLILILFIGCTPNPPISTVEVTRPITPETKPSAPAIMLTEEPAITSTLIAPPLPRYIQNIRPEPGSQLTIEAYDTSEKLSPYFSDGPSFTPSGSTICMALTYYWLALTGDTEADLRSVSQRTKLEVNGQIIPEPPETLAYMTLNRIVRGDDEAFYLSPTTRCWTVDLGTGVHTVKYLFEKTDGRMVEFTWQFAIVD